MKTKPKKKTVEWVVAALGSGGLWHPMMFERTKRDAIINMKANGVGRVCRIEKWTKEVL